MSSETAYTRAYTPDGLPCIVCKGPLDVRLAEGRKSKKPFVMLICPEDGRHFRGFINDKEYVSEVISLAEQLGVSSQDEGG